MQKSILRHIQNLPPNTALTAVYGLLGVRPIAQELDLRKLTLLGNILSQKSTLKYEIAQRWLSKILTEIVGFQTIVVSFINTAYQISIFLIPKLSL